MNQRTSISAELRSIVDRIDRLAKALSQGPRERDIWDKAQTFAAIISPLMIALVGGLFTYQWTRIEAGRTAATKQDELAIDRARVVKEFLPALTAEGDERRIAIIALSKIGYPELATGIAESKISESSLAALNTLAASEDPAERNAAGDVLARLFTQQRKNFVQILVERRPYASGFLLGPDVVVTANYVLDPRDTKDVTVVLANGKEVRAGKTFRDDTSGIGIIRLPEPAGTNGLPLLTMQPEIGAFVIAIGDRMGKGLVPIGGTVKTIHANVRVTIETGAETELRDTFRVQFGPDLAGVGGGPVLSLDGIVVGLLHSGGKTEEHVCVSSVAIARVVESLLGIKLHGPPKGSQAS